MLRQDGTAMQRGVPGLSCEWIFRRNEEMIWLQFPVTSWSLAGDGGAEKGCPR